MYDRWSAALMRWLRVPPRPEPPSGEPGSERIFHSGRNALRFSLALWGVQQVFALVGLAVGLWVLGEIKGSKQAASSFIEAASSPRSEIGGSSKRLRGNRGAEVSRAWISRWARKTPDLFFGLLTIIEALSVLTFLVLLRLAQ